MRVTRLDKAPPYIAPLHEGVGTLRLQGLEAGPTDRFWVGLSYYLPAGEAQESPTREETVYVVLDGELTITSDGAQEVLQQHDSVHLPKGTVRSVVNNSARPATLLVIIGTPQEQVA